MARKVLIENQTILSSMKYIKPSNKKVICSNCKWSWYLSDGGTRKYLCHKCGYDSKLNKFDMESLRDWKESNPGS